MSSAVPYFVERLNKVKYSVRASQAVVQYSVGSMVDFPDQTLMPAAPEQWEKSVERIHDGRLEKLLHVRYFGMPGSKDINQFREGVFYTRFPEWYFCPKCRRLKSMRDWILEFRKLQPKSTDTYMVRSMRCPKDKTSLVVARIITVCPDGHIDDFPWVEWVHARAKRPICADPELTLSTSRSSSEGLEGITVKCETCTARSTLSGAFNPGMLQAQEKATEGAICFRCHGRHPWKNTKDACEHYPRVMQRGASTVYFPVVESSLVIPPFSSKITTKVESSEKYKELLAKISGSLDALELAGILTPEMKEKTIRNHIQKQANAIAVSTLLPEDQVVKVLERNLLSEEPETTENGSEEETTQSLRYRIEEFEALSSESPDANIDDGDFCKELVSAEKYGISCVKSISLIHKIREVEALIGFTRIKPASREEGAKNEPKIVSIKESGTEWYPAYQIRGEGIFVEFDGDTINRFVERNPQIRERANHIDKAYRAMNNSPVHRSAKYVILHTLSHLLIKQLSFECGYGISSLKERIYCSDAKDGKEMAGILIYTANGDSEGTLGGLVRQGRPDCFPAIFKKAVESAMICSNDPVCSMSKGQGRESINLAACYSCTLIPETSCERNNLCLDRGMVVGTFADHSFGLYSAQLYGTTAWDEAITFTEEITEPAPKQVSPAPHNESPKPQKILKIVSRGMSLKTGKYSAIWKEYKGFAETKEAKAIYLELQQRSAEFEGLEKPFKDAVLVMEENAEIACDLMWEEAKVLFFTESAVDEYQAALGSDWTCICANSGKSVVDELITTLKGV